MLNRLIPCLALAFVVTLGACDKSEKSEASKEKPPTITSPTSGTAQTKTSQTSAQPKKGEASSKEQKPKATAGKAGTATGGEIVFNPLKPPAGYANCHHNHCHLVGGGVESYKQVMDKMGATKIIEPPKPPAPADVAAPPGDATRTASGLAYKMLEAGNSDQKPGPNSTVVAHLSSWKTDGTSLQSTSSRGKPANVPLARVFPGLQEAFQLMAVGSEYRFWIPANLTRRPNGGMVVFDIQLLGSRDPE